MIANADGCFQLYRNDKGGSAEALLATDFFLDQKEVDREVQENEEREKRTGTREVMFLMQTQGDVC